MIDSLLHSRAVEWLENAKNQWRLQTLQYRRRYNEKDGTYKQLPVRIRRFLNGTPVGMIGEVLKTLVDLAPYKSPVYNWEYDAGLSYRPTNTFITTDARGGDVSNTKDATYTIVQDLRAVNDGSEDWLGYLDTSMCSRIVTAEYHWDESEIEDVPDAEQGVMYQIGGVGRDSDTDLVSYSVQKTQAVTQYTEPYVTQCNKWQTTTVEIWDNVYGSPDDFHWDSVVNGGETITLPKTCSETPLIQYRLEMEKNQDCTYKISITKVAFHQPGDFQEFSVMWEQYKKEMSRVSRNQENPLDWNGTVYDHGLVTTYQSRMTDAGLWDNTVSTNRELPVSEAEKEVRVLPKYNLVTWTDSNQPSPAVALPAGSAFGSYKVTKTHGGLFDNEYSVYQKKTPNILGLYCQKTAFMHTHHLSSGVSAVGSDNHVSSASNGVVSSVRYDVDDYGAITRIFETASELEYLKAEKSKVITPYGTIITYRDRNVTPSYAEGLYSRLTAVSSHIGNRVQVETTDGNLRNVTVTSASFIDGIISSVECSKTILNHVHSIVSSVLRMGTDVASAANGLVYSTQWRVDSQTGGILKEEKKDQEIGVPNYLRDITVYPLYTVVSVVDRNQPVSPKDPTAVGSSLQVKKTDGGWYDITHQKVVLTAGGVEAKSCERTIFQHSDSVVTGSTTRPTEARIAGGGVTYSVSGNQDEHGIWHNKSEIKYALPVSNAVTSQVFGYWQAESSVLSSNNAPVSISYPSERSEAGTTSQIKRTKNPDGSVNTERVLSRYFTGMRAEETSSSVLHSSTEQVVRQEGEVGGGLLSIGSAVGLTTSTSSTTTESGLVDSAIKQVQAHPYSWANWETKKTKQYYVTAYHVQNYCGGSPERVKNVGEEVSTTLNESDGSINYTLTTITNATSVTSDHNAPISYSYGPANTIGFYTEKVIPNAATSIQACRGVGEVVHNPGKAGAYLETVSYTMNEAGTYDKVIHTEYAGAEAWQTWYGTYGFQNDVKCSVTTFTNVPGENLTRLIRQTIDTSGKYRYSIQVKIDINKFGLLDGGVTQHQLPMDNG